MRVLFLTNMWPSPDRPAAGSFVADLHRALTALGVTIEVFEIRPGRTGPTRYVLGALDFMRFERRTTFDLVHAHYGLVAAVAVSRRDTPVVASFCGSDLYKPNQQRISRWAGKRSNRAIVMSAAMHRLLGRRDAVVLPYGIDLNLFRPRDQAAARRRLELSPDVRYVLFPYSRARPEKRCELAAAAVDAAEQRTGSPVRLLEVHGRSREQYVEFVNAADAMILTSAWEGSPNAVKECLASEVPVVSVEVGDVPEILEGLPGCSTRGNNPGDLADGLIGAFQMGRTSGGRHRVTPYASDRIAERVLEIYQQVVH
jgi:teichuronic acid biosynthesis glycosyltransferase TuaC